HPDRIEERQIGRAALGYGVHQPLAKLGLLDHLEADADRAVRMLAVPAQSRLLHWPAPALLRDRDRDVLGGAFGRSWWISVGGDEGAASGLADEQAAGDELAESLTNGSAADAESFAELHLGRQALAGRELATGDQLADGRFDLPGYWDRTFPVHSHRGHRARCGCIGHGLIGRRRAVSG